MKVLPLALLIFALISQSRAADSASPTTSSRAVKDASSDADESEFRDPFDPFATESEVGQAKQHISDPLEPMNRAFFQFNDRLYFWVLKPVAKGYRKITPEHFRQSIKLFFVNARYPVRLVNNVLQGRMREAGIETARFILNSTVGIGGLFDPARDEWRLQPHAEDLDQTLGFYRIKPGFYLNWPVFGPSSVRGTVGTIGDSFLSPWNYIDGFAVTYGTRIYDTINSSSLRLGEYEGFKRATFDPYVSLRDAYFENRANLIKQ
jgi:phospholipid-binding lipoprotein MlaA